MNKHILAYLFAFLFFIFNNLGANASTIALSNCSQSDVQNAINLASDGDTIVCPDGSWTWSNVNIPNKNVTLKGAGEDNTIIMQTACRGLEKADNIGDKRYK